MSGDSIDELDRRVKAILEHKRNTLAHLETIEEHEMWKCMYSSWDEMIYDRFGILDAKTPQDIVDAIYGDPPSHSPN